MVLRNHKGITSEPPVSKCQPGYDTDLQKSCPPPQERQHVTKTQQVLDKGLKNLNGSVVKSVSPAGRRKPTALGKKQTVSKSWPKVLTPSEFTDSQQRPDCLHPKHTVTNKLQKQEKSVLKLDLFPSLQVRQCLKLGCISEGALLILSLGGS